MFLSFIGSVLYAESLAQPSGPPQGELARSPPPCGPAEEGRMPGEIKRLRVSQGPTIISRHSPGLVPQPDSSLRTGRRSLQMPAAPSSQLSSSSSSSGSSSTCAVPTDNVLILQASQCSMAKASRQPPIVFLPKLVYDMILSTDSSGLPKSASLLPSPSVMWTSSFRPLLSKMMTSTEQSLYYRQWTVPRPSHMDYGNRAEGCVDSFHPRRLLLSGPPQVGIMPAAPAQARPPGFILVSLPEDSLGDEGLVFTLCSFRGYPGFISVAVIQYPDTKQLREERVYLSSQFQVTIHHSREATGKNLKQLVTSTAKSRDLYACVLDAQLDFATLEPNPGSNGGHVRLCLPMLINILRINPHRRGHRLS